MDIEIIVFFLAYRTKQQSHVDQPFVQPLQHLVCIAAVSVKFNLGIGFVKPGEKSGYHVHRYRLSAADGYVSSQDILIAVKSFLGIFDKFKYFAGSALQKSALLSQSKLAFSTYKKLFSQLFFQIHHLL